MRRFIIAALTTSAMLAMPGAAHAAQRHTKLERAYLKTYREVVHRHGVRTAGRNVVKYGVRKGKDLGVRASLATLRRMLYVPKPQPVAFTPVASTSTSSSYQPPVSSYHAPAPTATSSGSGGYAIPSYIVQRESGGDYNAVNPSSGAYGAYQLMPAHFVPGGACYGLSKDPSGQDACAAKLWDGGRGASNWAETR